MKYIVFFIFYKTIQMPCPWLEDGNGIDCAMGHAKMVPQKDTVYFDNKASADSLYNLMVLRKDTAIYMNGGRGRGYILFYPYDSIQIKQVFSPSFSLPVTFKERLK